MKKFKLTILILGVAAAGFTPLTHASTTSTSEAGFVVLDAGMAAKAPLIIAAGVGTRVERRHDAVDNTADRVDDKQDFRQERRDCTGDGPDCRSDNRQDKRSDTVDRAEDRIDDRQDRR